MWFSVYLELIVEDNGIINGKSKGTKRKGKFLDFIQTGEKDDTSKWW